MRLVGPLTPVPEGRGQREAWTPGSDGRGAGGLEFEVSGEKKLGIQIDGWGGMGAQIPGAPEEGRLGQKEEGLGAQTPGCERGHAEGPNSWTLGKEAPEARDSWVLRRRALVAWTPGL